MEDFKNQGSFIGGTSVEAARCNLTREKSTKIRKMKPSIQAPIFQSVLILPHFYNSNSMVILQN